MRWLICLCALLWASCGGDHDVIRVGAKGFAEQRVLAEALVALIKADGRAVDPVVECKDTYECQRALRVGQIDLMVDYTGTGLAFVGASATDGAGLEQVRKLYKPLGLKWVVPLGFDNGYRLLVHRDRARALGLESIGDLARMEGGVRVAAPTEFLRRPGDGLAAMVRRYGLRTAAEPLVIDAPGERLEALLDGRVDVAVGYATDGAIVGLGLQVLEDSLGFFPPYDAAIVARTGALADHKDLEAVLNRLHNRISVSQMQKLNYAVEVAGQRPSTVASRFLTDEGLVKAGQGSSERAPVVLAVGRSDGLEAASERALRAVSQAFDGRPVQVKPLRDPVQAVASGKARLAVLGAERFFPRRRRGRFLREERLEAVAALGTRLVHVLRRADDLQVQDPLSGRVGVPSRDSGAAWAGEALLALAEQSVSTTGDVPALIAALKAREIDVALVLVEPGEARLSEGLSAGGVALMPLKAGWTANRVSRLPFFREARLPAGTYPGQPGPLESMASQVVIAAPSRQGLGEGGGGPAAAFHPSNRPLTSKQVQALASATRISEAPDPALPSAWNVQVGPYGATPNSELSPSMVDTLMNLFVFVFLLWLVRVTMRSRPA